MRFWEGMFACSSRGNTTTTTVQIGATKGTDGAYVQRLTNGAGSKEHIAGTLFPMYGHASGISADQNPKVQMRHMSAIVALKIVNQGDSKKENLEQEKNDSDKRKIVINDITFAVPAYSTSAISQKAIPIVGSFNVDPTNDINSASFTPVTNASSNSVKLEFASTEIDPGESATFYLAVRPFDVSNSVLGGSEKRTGLTLSITINGSTRSVEIPADTKFEAGKVTTLRVPVKLSYPKDSDAIGNSNFTLTMPEGTKVTSPLKVNGESIEKAWVVGDGISQTLTIHGYARDMIKALDVGFYASTLKGKNAAMTISKINIYLPDGDKENEIGSYTPLLDVIGTELEDDIRTVLFGKDLGPDHITIGLAKVAIAVTVSGGIPRDDTGALCFLYLTKFINPQTITFNGLISNGATNITDDILILDEAPIYKEIKAEVINRFLGERFADYAGNKPTCEGLQDIVNGKTDTNAAEITSQTLYNVLETVFREKGTMSMNVLSKDVDINLHNVFKGILPNVDALIDMLQTMRLNLEITTCPYHANKETGYGTKLAPIPLDKIAGEKYPIIFWGLDAYGPDKSAPTPVAD